MSKLENKQTNKKYFGGLFQFAMEAVVHELNTAVELTLDLPKVVSLCAVAKEERNALSKSVGTLVEKEAFLKEQLELSRAALEEREVGKDKALEGAVTDMCLGGPSRTPRNPLEYLLAEGAVLVLDVVSQALRRRQLILADLSRAQSGEQGPAISVVLANVVSLCELVAKCKDLPQVRAFVLNLGTQCQSATLALSLQQFQASLSKIGWGTALITGDDVSKELNPRWPEPASWLDICLTLELHCGVDLLDGKPVMHPMSLKPLWEPFRKRFIFHFLQTRETSKPEEFRDCSKHVLLWLSRYRNFVSTRVQESVLQGHAKKVHVFLDMVAEMSTLLAHRAKRDFGRIMGEEGEESEAATTTSSETFFDIVDELFAWSKTLEDNFGYALSDARFARTILFFSSFFFFLSHCFV